jgi:hypothetical protein
VSLGKTMSYSWFLGWALYDYGLMYVRMGDPEKARIRLHEALALFRRLGAREYARRVEQRLAELFPTAARLWEAGTAEQQIP